MIRGSGAHHLVQEFGAAIDWEQLLPFGAEIRDQDLSLSSFPVRITHSAQFAPVFYDTGSGFYMGLNYASNMFTAATVEQFCRSVKSVAMSISDRPDIPIGDILHEAGDIEGIKEIWPDGINL